MTWRVALAGGRRQRVFYALVGSRMRRVLQDNIDALARFVDSEPH
jgi:hypothetical protein